MRIRRDPLYDDIIPHNLPYRVAAPAPGRTSSSTFIDRPAARGKRRQCPARIAPSRWWGEAWKRLRVRPLFWFAVIIIFCGHHGDLALPSLFTSQDRATASSPVPSAAGCGATPFGFDKQGCDITRASSTVPRASVSSACSPQSPSSSSFNRRHHRPRRRLDRCLPLAYHRRLLRDPAALAAIVFMQMFGNPAPSPWSSSSCRPSRGRPHRANVTRGSVMSARTKNSSPPHAPPAPRADAI